MVPCLYRSKSHSCTVSSTSQAVCGRALYGALPQAGCICVKPLLPLSRGLLRTPLLKQSMPVQDQTPPVKLSVLHLQSVSSNNSSSQFQQQQQSGLLSHDSVQGDISSSDAQQVESQQAAGQEEEQWVCVEQTGRAEQVKRWSPAGLVHRMMVRTRRPGENQGQPRTDRVASRPDLADAIAMGRSS